MTEVTIDHIVSLIAFFGAMLLFTNLFLQTINTAIVYQRNSGVALKASDVFNNILLGSGVPEDWGERDINPLVFGLHQPETSLLALSSFSLLRLIYPLSVVSYSGTSFNNISIANGVSIFMPVTGYVDYPTISRLLSINGSYGFHVTIEPALTVSILQEQQHPLKLKIQVGGHGGVCGGAAVDCSVYYALKNPPYSSIEYQTNATFADATGTAILEFQSIDASEVSYSAIAQVHLGGLTGTGFYSSPLPSDSLIKILVTDYKNRKISLVHRADLLGGMPSNIFYNLTYVLPTQNYDFNSIQIENSTGTVNQNHPAYVQIPSFDPGILIIMYRVNGIDFGTIIMPWGVSSLGISVDFGMEPATSSWVATQLRQVIIGQISYQVRLALWSLTN